MDNNFERWDIFFSLKSVTQWLTCSHFDSTYLIFNESFRFDGWLGIRSFFNNLQWFYWTNLSIFNLSLLGHRLRRQILLIVITLDWFPIEGRRDTWANSHLTPLRGNQVEEVYVGRVWFSVTLRSVSRLERYTLSSKIKLVFLYGLDLWQVLSSLGLLELAYVYYRSTLITVYSIDCSVISKCLH